MRMRVKVLGFRLIRIESLQFGLGPVLLCYRTVKRNGWYTICLRSEGRHTSLRLMKRFLRAIKRHQLLIPCRDFLQTVLFCQVSCSLSGSDRFLKAARLGVSCG